MIKRGLTLVNAMHITASVFINDDAGLWAVPTRESDAQPHCPRLTWAGLCHGRREKLPTHT